MGREDGEEGAKSPPHLQAGQLSAALGDDGLL